MSAPLEETLVQVGSARFNHARTPPSGAPLLMLHGVTRRWQTFLPLISALAPRWRMAAFDFRGHGHSDRSPGNYRVIDYVRDAVAYLLDQFNEPAILYGHSLGAMVAAAVAAEAPEAVRAVILEDPPFETMGSRIAQTRWYGYFSAMQQLAGSARPVSELAREVARLPLAAPDGSEVTALGELRDGVALRFTAGCLSRLDPDVLHPIIAGQWLDGYDRQAILRRLCRPTLLLQADGAAGGMLTDRQAAEAEVLIPDCTRVRMAGSGHLMHWARTQETVNLIHGFLESLEPSASPRAPTTDSPPCF